MLLGFVAKLATDCLLLIDLLIKYANNFRLQLNRTVGVRVFKSIGEILRKIS